MFFDKEILPKLTYMYLMLDNNVLNTSGSVRGHLGPRGPLLFLKEK